MLFALVDFMKKILFSLLVLGAVTLAQAVPVNVTVSGGTTVVAAPASDLGDFGTTTVLNWLTSDIANYNSLTSSALPAPTTISSGLLNQTSGTGGTSINIDVTGFDYLFLHWGGKGGGWAQAFYVGGSSGDYTFDNSAIGTNPTVGGLSFYSYYGVNVPDGASTVILLGSALIGMAAAVRLFKKDAVQA